jgi:hypothetical protein
VIVTTAPATGRQHRARGVLRVVAACLAAATIALPASASAQRLTRDLFRPERGGFVAPQDLPLRKTPVSRSDALGQPPEEDAAPAPSRIGRPQTYGVDAAAGAAGTGFDSLNRKRKKPKLLPGMPQPLAIVSPARAATNAPSPVRPQPKLLPQPPERPLPPSRNAAKPPVSAAVAGTVPGQPPRRRLKFDDDPFAPLGDYAGSFLIKGAVELNGGYDSNPSRTATKRGSGFYKVSPELMVTSDWERHALVADLRGSFTGYGHNFESPPGTVSSAPTNLDRPDFNGHVDGRLDASRDTRLLGQGRLIVGTDNPGSPNVQAGLAKYPIFTTTGASAGIDQKFNRLQLTAVGNADRTVYQNSSLTDGSSSTNIDRNYNQYGGVGRASYDLFPGVKPFVEAEGDTRIHDTAVDRFGYQRDSNGGYAKAGTSFELSRILTGEASIGYAARTYTDPRLLKLSGLLTGASLVWSMSPLTTVKFDSTTSIDESTLSGVSGVLTRTYTAEVDHDFRRWLTAIGKFTYATYDYQGSNRSDRFASIEGDLVYKLNRNIWVKGQLRYDKLDSNVVGGSYNATVVMLGVRLQN